MRRLFLALLCLLAFPAFAQKHRGGLGVPPSPAALNKLTNPLATFKVRLGVPFLTHGPGQDWGDWIPTFFPKGDGTFYAYGANQQTWGTNVATMSSPTCGTMPCPSPAYAASFTGSISGTTLTASSGTGIAVGQGVNAIGVSPGTTIVSGSGTSWVVSTSQTVASTAMQTFVTSIAHGQSVGITCNNIILSTMTQTFPSGSVNAIPPAVSSDACGDWITAGKVFGGLYYAEVHNEGPANYSLASQSNESEGLWVSATGAPGAGWTPVVTAGSPGTIASSNIGVISNNLTGIGDGTFFFDGIGQFAYFYGSFFCATATCDYHNVIARAPTVLGLISVKTSTNITASGQVFTFAGLPANNDAITIGGTTLTFLTTGASCATNSVAIAGSVAAQLTGLYACLTASPDVNIAKYVYVKGTSTLTVGLSIAPGQWSILWQGSFTGSALNNVFNFATQLPAADWYGTYTPNLAISLPTQGFVGSSVSTITNTPYKAVAIDYRMHDYYKFSPFGNIGGVGLSIAMDYIHFNTYSWPLLNFDFQNFGGRADGVGGCLSNSPPDPSGTCGDLFLYGGFHSDVDGTNTLPQTHATWWSMWTPPENSLANRYIVGYPATFGQLNPRDIHEHLPQAGVTFETYINTGLGHYRSDTVNPGPTAAGGYETGWATNANLGYMMTNCPNSPSNIISCDIAGTANRIELCWSSSTDDYWPDIDNNGTTGNCVFPYKHVRTLGWLTKNRPAYPANALYACHTTVSHFATIDPACNGQTFDQFLGYSSIN